MRALAALLFLCAVAAPALAGETGALRVGTSGDYAPFSSRNGEGGDPPTWKGFDVDLARAYAEERGLSLELVRFRWPDLLANLRAGAFDVAMSGITIGPERSAAGRFTHPVALSGAVVLARPAERFPGLDALDRRSVRIGVNAGGHLERVALARFPNATVVAIADNASVREALHSLAVDAAVSDTLEAPAWLDGLNGAVVLGPFTRDRKALLVRADRASLAADLDAWLLAREADGSLAALRARHLGPDASAATAEPLPALLAAIDERFSLMPWVAAAKRSAGLPLQVPEREEIVIDAAVAGVAAAAAEAGGASPPEAQVRALFRALIDAAVEVQWQTVRDPSFAPPDALPDLDGELRPALLRIGEKISALLVALPPDLDAEGVLAATGDELRAKHLSDPSKRAIAGAVIALSHAERAPVADP